MRLRRKIAAALAAAVMSLGALSAGGIFYHMTQGHQATATASQNGKIFYHM